MSFGHRNWFVLPLLLTCAILLALVPTWSPLGSSPAAADTCQDFSSSYGTFQLCNEILAEYNSLGGPDSSLGYPVMDQASTSCGTGQFVLTSGDGENDGIWWSSTTGAHPIEGPIAEEYGSLDYECSVLGFPTADAATGLSGSGLYQTFGGCCGPAYHDAIYYSDSTGAHEIHGLISDEYASVGGDNSFLGFPTSDEMETPSSTGRYQTFAPWHDAIYYSAATGAHEVDGTISDDYASIGAEGSYLGYPAVDSYSYLFGVRQDYQLDSIFYNGSNGWTEPMKNLSFSPG
jgi:uncharacterized protein with LGFP repeats